MSTELKTLKNTGKDGVELTITSFASKHGVMVQLTQGFGGSGTMLQLGVDEPGYIQLTILDAYKVIQELSLWIKNETTIQADLLQAKIDEDQKLKKTIFNDVVECQRFIQDLEFLIVPIRLLDGVTL